MGESLWEAYRGIHQEFYAGIPAQIFKLAGRKFRPARLDSQRSRTLRCGGLFGEPAQARNWCAHGARSGKRRRVPAGLSEAGWLIGFGIAAGVLVSMGMSKVLQQAFFKVQPWDGETSGRSEYAVGPRGAARHVFSRTPGRAGDPCGRAAGGVSTFTGRTVRAARSTAA